MKRREIVADLVKTAFIVLIVKVMASSSVIMPWNSFVDNVCIAFAICVLLAKVSRLTFTLGKLIILAFMSLVTMYTCLSMRQYDLMITLVAVCLLIDEDLDAYVSLMFKTQAFILIGHVAVAGFLSLIGEADSYWIMTDDRLRFTGGFTHPNVLSCYTLSCMAMFAWIRFGRITSNQFSWLLCISVLSYALNRSRTGLLLNLFLLLLILVAQNEKQIVEKTISIILFYIFPVLTAVVFWAQGQFQSGNRIALFLDELLTGRIKYAAYGYLRSGLTWLPRYLDYVDTGVVGWTPEWRLNTFTFDNLFSFIFIQMGMIWIGIITVMIAVVCKKFSLRNKVFILIWVLYGMVEVHGLNCFKFFPLILLTTLLSRNGAERYANRSN